jgi:hypothetical protein
MKRKPQWYKRSSGTVARVTGGRGMRRNGFGTDPAAEFAARLGDEEARGAGIEPGRIGGGLDEAMEDAREQLIALGWAAALLAGIGLLALALTRKLGRR